MNAVYRAESECRCWNRQRVSNARIDADLARPGMNVSFSVNE